VHRGLENEIEEKENIQEVRSASVQEHEPKAAVLFDVFEPKFAPNVREGESNFPVEKP
jgi:hypothetical protein